MAEFSEGSQTGNASAILLMLAFDSRDEVALNELMGQILSEDPTRMLQAMGGLLLLLNRLTPSYSREEIELLWNELCPDKPPLSEVVQWE